MNWKHFFTQQGHRTLGESNVTFQQFWKAIEARLGEEAKPSGRVTQEEVELIGAMNHLDRVLGIGPTDEPVQGMVEFPLLYLRIFRDTIRGRDNA